MKRSASFVVAVVGAAALSLPPIGTLLEANMASHMLVQLPLLVMCGYCSLAQLPRGWRAALMCFNANGITGLWLAMLISAYWMLPVALDRAVIDPRVDAAKAASLLLGGAALNLSWRPAGAVLQAFFIGNWCAMEILAGLLYQQSSRPLCSAYPLNDQFQASLGLMLFGASVGLLWGAEQIHRGILSDRDAAAPLRRL